MDHRLGAVFKVDKGLSRNNLNIFAGLFVKFLRCDPRNPDYRDPLRFLGLCDEKSNICQQGTNVKVAINIPSHKASECRHYFA
jgi:hypothetical protein